MSGHHMDERPSPPSLPQAADGGSLNADALPGGLRASLEAVLTVADGPQRAEKLAVALGVDVRRVSTVLEELSRSYDAESRGFELHCGARGWQYVSRAALSPAVASFLGAGQHATLSQAALEALAIIAYKQPITRAGVAAIRGVNSDGVVRQLILRDLICEHGADPDTHAALLATTDTLLDKLGIASIDELPSLAPFLSDARTAIAEAKRGADRAAR